MQTALILLGAVFLAADAERSKNWPEYRGPKGDGSSAATGLPIRWSEKENLRWKVAIEGKAWSSPVVWGNQVWVTNAPADGKQRFAVCVDRRSGKIIHNIKVFDDPKPGYCHSYNSHASPTPAIEKGRVFVHFGSCGTACLDTASGKILWRRRDLPCDHHRGSGSSPILYGDLLFVSFDGIDRQFVVALNKDTGKTAWKKTREIAYGTDNGDLRKAYGTASIIQVAGKPQLVSPAAVASVAYNPLNGEVIWQAYHGGMNAAARPVFAKGNVFLCSGDGGLGLIAVRPDGSGNVTKTHVAFQRKKGVPNRSSLCRVGDMIYMITEGGVVTGFQAETGQDVCQGRLPGQFIASPIVAGKHIFFFNRQGTGYVVGAGRKWNLLATNRLDDGCMASPAAVGKSLFVRTATHLYCLEQRQ